MSTASSPNDHALKILGHGHLGPKKYLNILDTSSSTTLRLVHDLSHRNPAPRPRDIFFQDASFPQRSNFVKH